MAEEASGARERERRREQKLCSIEWSETGKWTINTVFFIFSRLFPTFRIRTFRALSSSLGRTRSAAFSFESKGPWGVAGVAASASAAERDSPRCIRWER